MVSRAVEQVSDPERKRHLLDRSGDRRRTFATVLEPERELGAHGRHHDLCLGILEQRPDDRRELAGTVIARVEPGDGRPARERATVKMGYQSVRGSEQRRLPRPRDAGHEHELAVRHLKRHVSQRRPRGTGIRVGHAIELEHAHHSIPRRSANGATAQAASATLTAAAPGPTGELSAG